MLDPKHTKVMNPKCIHPVIETIMDRYADATVQFLEIYHANGIFINPLSYSAFHHAIPCDKVHLGFGGCVHACFDENGNLLKIGSTAKLHKRIHHIYGKFMFLLATNKIPMEVDLTSSRIWYKMIQELHNEWVLSHFCE